MANISACTDAGAALAPLLREKTGHAAGDPIEDYSQTRGGYSFPLIITVA